jgi:radical SAM protein with 4Fe4S-binding SPASM domain
MFTLSTDTVIRPEPHGALLFQRKTAETALLDMEGLDTLYLLLKGRLCERPVFFLGYLEEKRFIEPVPSDAALAPDSALVIVEAVRDAAPTTSAPPRSLVAPETIHLCATSRCDQACAGCFYSARSGGDIAATDMPLALFEQIVKEASEARVFQIALGGGEPLLHSQVLQMLHTARQNGIVANLTTNGNCLTVDLAMTLKEAGIGQVQISLNGATEETNAATRPNFHGAMSAIKACRRANLPFGINFLLTRTSLPELDAVIVLGNQTGAATVNVLRPKPPTTDPGWLSQESLTADAYGKLRRKLCRLKGKSGGQTRITIDASLTFLLTNRPPELFYQHGVWGCSAARRFVTVTESGSVLPCSHVRVSDVGDGQVMQAWLHSKVFHRFRTLEEAMCGPCRSCRYLPVCRGCPAVAMAFGGEFTSSDPHCPNRVGQTPPEVTPKILRAGCPSERRGLS